MELKNTLKEFKDRCEQAKERICKLGDKTMEIIESKEKNEKS